MHSILVTFGFCCRDTVNRLCNGESKRFLVSTVNVESLHSEWCALVHCLCTECLFVVVVSEGGIGRRIVVWWRRSGGGVPARGSAAQQRHTRAADVCRQTSTSARLVSVARLRLWRSSVLLDPSAVCWRCEETLSNQVIMLHFSCKYWNTISVFNMHLNMFKNVKTGVNTDACR